MRYPKKVLNQKRKNSTFQIESLEERAMLTAVVHDLSAEFAEISGPNSAWALNAGNRELNHSANWIYDDQPIWTSLNEAQVSQFKSASDLDFSGEFVYAVNAGGPSTTADSKPITIGDATTSQIKVGGRMLANAVGDNDDIILSTHTHFGNLGAPCPVLVPTEKINSIQAKGRNTQVG